MKRHFALLVILIICAGTRAYAQDKSPLKLVQTIDLPGVRGRFDHLDVDVAGKRLFVVGVESNSVEVVDLAAGKWMRSLTGFKTPPLRKFRSWEATIRPNTGAQRAGLSMQQPARGLIHSTEAFTSF